MAAEGRAGTAARQAADLLDREARCVVDEWVHYLQEQLHPKRRDLSDKDFENSAMGVVKGVAEALRRNEPNRYDVP